MAAPAKLVQVMGLLSKEEATYGTAVSLTTTADGQLLQYKDRKVPSLIEFNYAFDGALGPSVSALGQQIRVAPSGRSLKGDLPMRARGAGAAYATAIVPSIHKILKASGFDAAVTTTPGSEKWAYTPTAPGTVFTSLTLGCYSRAELATLAGVVGSLKLDAPDTAPPIFTFGAMGIMTALPADNLGPPVVPTITYPDLTVQPPLGGSVTLVVGSFTTNAVVMSSSFDLGRTFSPRVVQSGNGQHLGFIPEDRAPTIKVVLESTALVATPFHTAAGFDPYNLRESGNQLAVSIQFGSAQYNRYKIAFPQAQLIDFKPGNNGVIATMELTFAAANSTPSSADDVTVTFD